MEGSEISWERTPVEVTFTFRAEGALSWSSKNDAQRLCPIFDASGLKSGPAPSFVIFCGGPLRFKATVSK